METNFDITAYNHWGFAEWIQEEFKTNSQARLSANIYEDETESVFYVDIYSNGDLCDSFYYIDEHEIIQDLQTARKQFSTTITDHKPLN